MRISLIALSVLGLITSAQAATDINTALQHVRTSCRGISNDLERIKTSAGLGTATGAVGTVMGGIALGTGIAKSKTDKQIEKWEKVLLDRTIDEIETEHSYVEIDEEEVKVAMRAALKEASGKAQISDTNLELRIPENEMEPIKKSKKLGNIRTGTLATSAVVNVAGAVVSATDRSRNDLRERISACTKAVNELSDAYKNERVNGDINIDTALTVDSIIDICGQWKKVDVNKIGNMGTGATVASSIGASTGLVGAITSGKANKASDDTTISANKEKSLNTAANVLAGTTAAASGVSTVLQAARISEIKTAISVAYECEGALK